MRPAILSWAARIVSMLSILATDHRGLTLIIKNFVEVVHNSIFDFAQLSLATKQFFHRSHYLAVTGDYQIEVTEIGIYVERKAVSRDPTRDVYADGCDLSCTSAGLPSLRFAASSAAVIPLVTLPST